VNRQLGHLTDARIQEYLTSSGETREEQLQWVDHHLSECSRCLEIALEAQRVQLGFLENLPASPEPHTGWPDAETIMSFAAGGAPDNVRDIIQHVAHCDFCGSLLKRCKEDFSQDFSADEEKFLSELATSGKQWQQKFVRRHALVTQPSLIRRVVAAIGQIEFGQRWRRLTAATALVALGVFGALEGPVIVDAIQLASARSLLVSASSEQANIEMRIPNARYTSFGKEMGGSPREKSAAWLEASAMIANAKKKNAGRLDRGWLQAEGLASLLEGTPGSASRASTAFEKANAEGMDDPTLEIERAASYFESKPPDVGKAIDVLGSILKRPKLSPEERRVATFDLAIAYEGMNSWSLAVQTWDEYLALDSSSDWAKDARSRRDKAKSKILELKSLDQNPSSFLQSPALQFRVEEYQDIALESWLPLAVRDPRSAEATATRKLAELLAAQHSDPFLRDLLNAASPDETPALEALGRAIRKNKTGLYGEAVRDAQLATTNFSLHHNVPGELLARFEEVFAAQQGLESLDCEAQALELQRRLSSMGYRWLGAQVALERATCLNLAGDLAGAEKQLTVSRNLENKGFPVLGLRILGLTAGIERLQNKDDESWHDAVEGLRLFGQGTYPWQRLYQFYSVLEQYAEKRHLLNAQQALLQQAIAIQEAAPPEDEDVILKGALYGRLSTVCLALKEDALASKALEKSNLLLARGGNEPYAAKYVVYVKNDLAQAQLRLGAPKMAISILEPARPLIGAMEHEFIALDFYKTLGSSYLQWHRLDESASSYEEGIVIAERNLASITDESDRLKWMNEVDPVYRGLALVLSEQGKETDALWLWEWYISRSAQSQRAPSQISWDSLQKTIFKPPSSPVSGPRLIYAVFEDRLQIWIAKTSGIKSTSMKIKQSDMENRVNDFALECATRPTQQYRMDYLRKIGQPLGAFFLQPVVLAELEASRTVTVELDPRLSRLPVIALMLPNGHYFGQDYSITRSPGLFLERDLRTVAAIGLDSSFLVAFGAPTTGEDRLPQQDQDEVRGTVREIFSKAKFKSVEQDSWMEVSRELKNHEAFVFVGHGVPEGTHTALVYGKVLLKAKDFPPAMLKYLRLAIVAACSSGAGENPLQDTDTLTHAFLAAGVPNIIVTRWDVDSEQTAHLLASFFKNLGKGEPVSQALYHARNNRISEKSHPYWWAGIELVGRSN